MKLFTLFILAATIATHAQSLTVHAVDEKTGQPLSGIPVTIRANFLEPHKAKKGEVVTVKSDKNGTAIFTNLALGQGGFSVNVFSMSVEGVGLLPIFFPPGTPGLSKSINSIYTSLPADITVRVHHRTLKEMLELIYPGP